MEMKKLLETSNYFISHSIPKQIFFLYVFQLLNFFSLWKKQIKLLFFKFLLYRCPFMRLHCIYLQISNEGMSSSLWINHNRTRGPTTWRCTGHGRGTHINTITVRIMNERRIVMRAHRTIGILQHFRVYNPAGNHVSYCAFITGAPVGIKNIVMLHKSL